MESESRGGGCPTGITRARRSHSSGQARQGRIMRVAMVKESDGVQLRAPVTTALQMSREARTPKPKLSQGHGRLVCTRIKRRGLHPASCKTTRERNSPRAGRFSSCLLATRHMIVAVYSISSEKPIARCGPREPPTTHPPSLARCNPSDAPSRSGQ